MDVIAAIATGTVPTAIGIVRVSGDGCLSLCDAVFRANSGRPLADLTPRTMVLEMGIRDRRKLVKKIPRRWMGSVCMRLTLRA